MKKEKNKKLPIFNEANMTCYDAVEMCDINCQKVSCKNWISFEKGKNCILVTTKKGPLTLNEIGKIYGLTRMRICQIEKMIYEKIRNFITD